MKDTYLYGGKAMAKKRVNIYVDEEKYAKLKEITAVTGDTVASIFDEAMTSYIDTITLILQTKDKEVLFNHFHKKIRKMQEEMESSNLTIKE